MSAVSNKHMCLVRGHGEGEGRADFKSVLNPVLSITENGEGQHVHSAHTHTTCSRERHLHLPVRSVYTHTILP